MKRRPTRRDLLIVIERLQGHVSNASAYHGNDRDPDGFERGQQELREAFDLCVEARSYEPPLAASGPWSKKTLTTIEKAASHRDMNDVLYARGQFKLDIDAGDEPMQCACCGRTIVHVVELSDGRFYGRRCAGALCAVDKAPMATASWEGIAARLAAGERLNDVSWVVYEGRVLGAFYGQLAGVPFVALPEDEAFPCAGADRSALEPHRANMLRAIERARGHARGRARGR